MTAPRHQADLNDVRSLLLSWIERQATDKELGWLLSHQEEVANGAPRWKFFTAFSAVPRYVSKADLDLEENDLARASDVRPGWTPREWSLDEAARALLVLSYPSKDEAAYLETMDQVFSTADVRESVALYRILPLYRYPQRFAPRAAEGIRSNMTSVFNAVAHENPYPKEYLDEAAWNQMVLKALFVGSPLFRIQGLDERANPELARMLVDYAHERWAAGRTVSPELWRPVGPFAADDYLEDLGIVLTSDEEVQREAGALALADAGSKHAREMLAKQTDLMRRIEAGDLTWPSFSRNRIPVAA